MHGIQEEDAEFWQLIQQQQATNADDEDGCDGASGIGRRAGGSYRAPLRLQAGIKASFSRSCPCLSLASVGLQGSRAERQETAMRQLSTDNDDVDNSGKQRRLRLYADRVQPRTVSYN